MRVHFVIRNFLMAEHILKSRNLTTKIKHYAMNSLIGLLCVKICGIGSIIIIMLGWWNLRYVPDITIYSDSCDSVIHTTDVNL